ncbi:MAG: heparinase II/III family protein [Pseudomonadota bacterium]
MNADPRASERQVGSGARQGRLARLGYANPLYRLALIGGAPKRLLRLPPDPWPGDGARGQAILAGKLVCAGKTVSADRPDWFSPALGVATLTDLHRFDWLDDLAAAGGEPARRRARDLIALWLDAEHGWHEIAWAPEVLGARVAAWLAHAKFISRGEGDELGPRILASLARQVRHLSRVAGRWAAGGDRLIALKGLIYATLCGIGGERRARSALKALAGELAYQVLPDGGHIERSPQVHLRALAALVDIRDMLRAAGHEAPAELHSAIERMAPMLRFFRHGDGGLALFNDSNEESPAFIDAVLVRAHAKGRAPERASDSGYQRLAAERVLLLVDAGAPPPPGLDRHAHAGTLSFEMSYGKERLIVNCGAYPSADPVWRRAQRFSAAHSTLVVDETNSSEVRPAEGLGRRPATVTCVREEADGNTWLTISHDGYLAQRRLVHRRRLYLAQDGADLRGEDALLATPLAAAEAAGGGPQAAPGHHGAYALRFHLHPEVQASLIQNGAAALVRLPSGAAWRLVGGGGRLELAESVYLGARGLARRTQQIVISGPIAGAGAVIKWALKRVAKG